MNSILINQLLLLKPATKIWLLSKLCQNGSTAPTSGKTSEDADRHHRERA